MQPVPYIPPMFITLSERFGLLLAGGFAIMTLAPLDKLGPGRTRSWRATALLVVLFSLFTILGTYNGNIVFQSFANLRAMGAVTAGLFGGPMVGALTGLIAGGHRYFIDVGGFSAVPCGLATFLEGLAAGLFAWRFPSRSLDWGTAMTFAAVGEAVHMCLVLGLARPYAQAVDLVEVIGLPMILLNGVGAAIFVQALRMQMHFRDLRDSSQARQILSIANRTLPHLRAGLSAASARATAEIILDETRVAAVALTSNDMVMAHVGAASDHHRAGHSVCTQATRRVATDGIPLFVTGHDEIGCQLEACPLCSAIIVPLRKGDTILGCLKLYGTKDRPLDQTLFELAKGLADLFATQIELEDIGIKNQLLARAEFRRLQAQINPHFLFNSLNTVASFCRTAPGQARELILDLARYMRRNLDTSREAIHLAEEVEQIRAYLVIEKARFGERIRAVIDIDPETEHCLVPPLLIQPLVENSVRHGILGNEEGGVVRLATSMEDGHVVVVVEDDGAGMPESTRQGILNGTPVTAHGEGIGASNCNQRLVQLYGPAYALSIDSAPGMGTRITFRVPASTDAEVFASAAA